MTLGTPFQTPVKRKEKCANKKPSLGIRIPVICVPFLSVSVSLHPMLFPCFPAAGYVPVLTLPVGAEGRCATSHGLTKAALP